MVPATTVWNPEFSNLFCLVLLGVNYASAEQYYMCHKALHFKDLAAADAIMRTSNPKAAKRIGARVRGFDQRAWYPFSVEVLSQN